MEYHERLAAPSNLFPQLKSFIRGKQTVEGTPVSTGDPVKLARDFIKQTKIDQQSGRKVVTQFSLLPPSYPPCAKPLKGLEKVKLSELVLEIPHNGQYVLVRSVTEPDREMSVSVSAIVKDEYGTALTLQLYQQELEKKRSAQNILPKGSILAIKEPFVQVMFEGNHAIRVDHKCNVLFLPSYDLKVPECWRSDGQSCANSAILKKKADGLMKSEKYYEALDCYSQVLNLECEPEMIDAVRLNSALAFLKTEQFEATISELQKLNEKAKLKEKALYRKGMALYGLGQYKSSSEYFTELCLKNPNNNEAQAALKRCIARLKEETSGIYGFRALRQKSLDPDKSTHDCATYASPVEIKSSLTYGTGRGLFTTKPVRTGDLLLCEKAFACVFVDHKAITPDMYLRINPETLEMTRAAPAQLFVEVISKLNKNPSLLHTVTDLYFGNSEAFDVSETEDSPVIDIFLVERIVALNGVSYVDTSISDDHPRDAKVEAPEGRYGAYGLWTLASYANHSCNNNASLTAYGNMVIMRATRDLAANTEVTVPYQFPPDQKEQPRLDQWGFACECEICRDEVSTPKSSISKRRTLCAKLEDILKKGAPQSYGKAREILEAIAKTYSKPASEVPRFDLYNLQLRLAAGVDVTKKPRLVLEFALGSLDSLGFVIEGGVPEEAANAVTIQKWGFMSPDVVGCWLQLEAVYVFLAPDRADAAKEYAKIAYRCCKGEDESFEKTYSVIGMVAREG